MDKTYTSGIYLTVLCFILLIKNVHLQACTTKGDIIGVESPADYSNILDANSNKYFMICDNIHYALQCCGTLNRFQYYTKADGDIEMMLWRPVGGTLYKLIGSVSDTVTGTDPNVGEQRNVVVDRIQVQEGDCIGWYTPGVDMVTHKRVRDGSEVNTLSLESVTIDRDAPVDWAGASSEAIRKFFAVNMRVTVPSAPEFPTASVLQSMNDNASPGTSLLTVSCSDRDTAETVTLTTAGADSIYFDFVDHGNMTGTLSVSNTSVAPLSDKTANIAIFAVDACGNQATMTVSILVVNQPPDFVNLESSATVSESVPVDTLITSFTCVDAATEVDASVDTVNPNNAPNTGFFFVQTESGSGTEKVFGIYARSQADSSQGQFNYDSVNSYIVTIQCTDSKETRKKNITVNILETTTTSTTSTTITTTTEATTTEKTTAAIPADTTITEATTTETTTETTTAEATTTETTTAEATTTEATTTETTTAETTTTETTTDTTTTEPTTTETTTAEATTTKATTTETTTAETTTTEPTTTETTKTEPTTQEPTTAEPTTLEPTTTEPTTTEPTTTEITEPTTTEATTADATSVKTATTTESTTVATTTDAPTTEATTTEASTNTITTETTASVTEDVTLSVSDRTKTTTKATTTAETTTAETTTAAETTTVADRATTKTDTESGKTTLAVQTTSPNQQSNIVTESTISEYKTFFDDRDNIPWFVLAMVLLAAMVIVLAYVIAKCVVSCKPYVRKRISA